MISISKDQIYMTCAFLDPAGGKRDQPVKKVRARSAIVVISADTMNRIFVRHTWADRCPVGEIYRQVYAINALYHPQQFGVEGSAQQSIFADGLIIHAAEHNENINIINVQQPLSVTKEFRIRTHIQPLMPDGRLFMKQDQQELKDELVTFPMSNPVDLVDALASAISMIPKRLSLHIEDDERDAHLEYLRDSGAPIYYIEQVAARYENRKPEGSPEDFADYFQFRRYRT